MAGDITLVQVLVAWVVLIAFMFLMLKLNDYIHRTPKEEKPKAQKFLLQKPSMAKLFTKEQARAIVKLYETYRLLKQIEIVFNQNPYQIAFYNDFDKLLIPKKGR